MAIPLKYNTASQYFVAGPFVDDTDGKTYENALTINASDVKLYKSDSTTATVDKNSGGLTYITSSNGLYYGQMNATDCDEMGPMVAFIAVTGALPLRIEFIVLQANVYESLIGGTTYLETNPGKFSTSGATLSLKNRAGSEDSTRAIASATADPITGLS